MKRRIFIRLLIAAGAIALAALAWRVAYENFKHTDNIPSLRCVAQMEEAEIHKKLEGYQLHQLMEVWGKPQAGDSTNPVWEVDERTSLMVGIKPNGVAVAFHVYETGAPMAP